MSTAPQERTSLDVSVTVEVPVEHAFRVFTERFDDIKPHEHNLLEVPIARTVLEPRAGGTISDIGVDGSTCAWARVLAYEPPHRLVFSWDISPQWRLEPDHARTSEVEVRFVAESAQRTRVELEHRHLERHGEGWEGFTSLDAGDGWPLYLDRFRTAAEQPPAPAMFEALDNIGVAVSDVPRAIAFYTEVLGFPGEGTEEEGTVQLGGSYLYLFKTATAPATPGRDADLAGNPVGVDHLSFRVPDFDAAVAELQRRGVEFVAPTTGEPGSFRYRPFRDPDGTMLYVVARS